MIICLIYEVGNQIKEPQHRNETFLKYVSNLFSSSHDSSTWQTPYTDDTPLVLSNMVRTSMDLPFRSSKIKKYIDSFETTKISRA